MSASDSANETTTLKADRFFLLLFFAYAAREHRKCQLDLTIRHVINRHRHRVAHNMICIILVGKRALICMSHQSFHPLISPQLSLTFKRLLCPWMTPVFVNRSSDHLIEEVICHQAHANITSPNSRTKTDESEPKLFSQIDFSRKIKLF